MKFIITAEHCEHQGRPPHPSGETIELIFGNVWRGPVGGIPDADRKAWDAKETPEGAQSKADMAQRAAKDYTDERETVIREAFAHGDGETLAAAGVALSSAIEALKGSAGEEYNTLKKLQAHIETINEAISSTATPDTIDTLNEALAFIREHRNEIESLVNTYIKKEAIANDLTTNNATKVLSAAQGVELKALIDAITASLAGYVQKANGERLITDAEATKLAGIDERANAYTHPESHPADIITDTEEKVVMTAAEREKLAGIEASANAYTLPPATADTLGGVKAGKHVTIAEDGTISAAAPPYELPKASASVLGGIKVGEGLEIAEDGTLSAPGGSGGEVAVSPDAGNTLEKRKNGLFVPASSGGGGNSVLVLPYVAAETDAAGIVTNSAAFVSAWGGILALYLAAPDSYALYMEIDGGGGIMLRIPCTVVNMGGDQTQVQWLVSGFGVVDIPASATGSVSCKATCMAAVICNPAGQMQSVVLYALSGITGANGEPNLLDSDSGPVVIDLSGIDTSDQAQLKAAVQPAVKTLVASSGKPCAFRFGNGDTVHASYVVTGAQLLIAATGVLDIMDTPFSDTVPLAYYLLKATVQDGTVQSAAFHIKSANVVTKEALSGKAALVPYSLEEQPVPGEFWNGKQVYIRTFAGTTPAEPDGHSLRAMTLEPAATACQYLHGGIQGIMPHSFAQSGGIEFNNNLYWTYDSNPGYGLRVMGAYAPIENVRGNINNYLGNHTYEITFKYTKA